MSVKVTFDKISVTSHIESATRKAVAYTSQQILSDCNRFCPNDQGALVSSSMSNSKTADGLLVWATPYARYLYYGLLMVDSVTGSPWARKGDRKVLTNIPLKYSTGGKLWCERAREMYNSDWKLICENALKEGL